MTEAVKNNLKEDSGIGTSYQAEVEATYDELVKVFGEPHELNGDKTLAEWSFKERETGAVFTIYDWKNYGMRKENITEWHIGGVDRTCRDLFYKYFDAE